MLGRRDELVEEFKETSQSYKRAKVAQAHGQTMIGKWEDIDSADQ